MSIFSETQKKTLPRNKFDMSFDNKLTTKFGRITPMLCQELMPGDKVRHTHQAYVQFAPFNELMMHRFYLKTEYFYVPYRLVYDDFNTFLVGGEDGTEILQPPCATVQKLYNKNLGNCGATSTLGDYLGLPTESTVGNLPNGKLINTMPFRAYQLIYNDWYRDENLIPKLDIPRVGGIEADADLPMLCTIRNRAWRKDYFTSALPWPQKGPEVKIPLGDVAYVYAYINDTNPEYPANPAAGSGDVYFNSLFLKTDPNTGDVSFTQGTMAEYNQDTADTLHNHGFKFLYPDPDNPEAYDEFRLVADLRQATATSIEELRRAYAVQAWLELNAIGGTRDVEQIYNHFGVKVPDYRLGRPEYIAGYSQEVTIGNVYSTNSNNADSDNIQGYPVSIANLNSASDTFNYYAHEHGYLIGLLTVVPRAAYFQGIPRMLGMRMDKFDYYWPEFAQLGEQPIYADELYVNDNSGDVFGYTPRYAEFKFANDEVHGDYRTTLNEFHDARIFTQEPALNKDFIEVSDELGRINRIFNVEVGAEDNIYVDIYHDISKISSMVYFGNPKI